MDENIQQDEMYQPYYYVWDSNGEIAKVMGEPITCAAWPSVHMVIAKPPCALEDGVYEITSGALVMSGPKECLQDRLDEMGKVYSDEMAIGRINAIIEEYGAMANEVNNDR